MDKLTELELENAELRSRLTELEAYIAEGARIHKLIHKPKPRAKKPDGIGADARKVSDLYSELYADFMGDIYRWPRAEAGKVFKQIHEQVRRLGVDGVLDRTREAFLRARRSDEVMRFKVRSPVSLYTIFTMDLLSGGGRRSVEDDILTEVRGAKV